MPGEVAMAWPPGHFYSPVPSLDEVRAREDRVFAVPRSVPGVDLREDAQLALVDELAPYCADQPFTAERSPGLRYHFENPFFGAGDGIVLHCLLRHLRPPRVVEIGSGFSSALMLDTDERFLGPRTSFTFVDPYPERLLELLGDESGDRAELIDRPVQDIAVDFFDQLRAGDVLFIDSTHVAKVGSDVNVLLLDVLPRLAPGVWVHVHDILYPFEYPRDWIYGGRSWNEAYLLRAFLAFNTSFRIELFNSFLGHFHHRHVSQALPPWSRNTGGSIWLRRF